MNGFVLVDRLRVTQLRDPNDQLIHNEVVSVQPMTRRFPKIFFMDFQFGKKS